MALIRYYAYNILTLVYRISCFVEYIKTKQNSINKQNTIILILIVTDVTYFNKYVTSVTIKNSKYKSLNTKYKTNFIFNVKKYRVGIKCIDYCILFVGQ